MTTINYDHALDLLKQVAAQYPDHVYGKHFTDCEYFNNDTSGLDVPTPRCIVGEVLHTVGVPDQLLDRLEGTITDKYLQARLQDEADIDISSMARGLLDRVQYWQDSWLVTWTEAVKLAEAGLTRGQSVKAKELLGRDIEPSFT